MATRWGVRSDHGSITVTTSFTVTATRHGHTVVSITVPATLQMRSYAFTVTITATASTHHSRRHRLCRQRLTALTTFKLHSDHSTAFTHRRHRGQTNKAASRPTNAQRERRRGIVHYRNRRFPHSVTRNQALLRAISGSSQNHSLPLTSNHYWLTVIFPRLLHRL